MFFRFVASLMLVVLVSMVGIGMEKQTLQMKRAVSRQYFQMDLLLEMHAKLRLSIQELTAPSQLAAIEAETHGNARPLSRPNTGPTTGDFHKPTMTAPNLPLLRWEHPAPGLKP